MGIAAALIISVIICLIALVTRPVVVLYILLFIIIFFEEYGTGFTSSSGSLFFNQEFLNFLNLKVIEIIFGITYTFILLTYKSNKVSPYLRFERVLFFAFIGLVVFLCFIELWNHNSITFGGWRSIVLGFLLFHMLYRLLDTKEKFLLFVKTLILMLGARALIGLVVYWLGYGVESNRGVVPFFWDSRQIDGFVFGIMLIFGYIMHYRALAATNRMLGQWLAITIFMILSLTVILSIRRTLWFEMVTGVVLCMITSRQARIHHYLILGMTIVIGITVVLSVPALEGFRNRMGTYIESTNLLDESVAKQRENEAHIDNVEQYFRIVMQDPRVLFMGYRGRSGEDYRSFKAASGSEGPLGTSHNGILATLQFFGIVGLSIYMFFYLRPIFLYKRISRLPSSAPMRYIGVSSLFFLFLEFVPSLIFVPPFYNSTKGVVYIFLSLFLLRASIYYSNQQLRESEDRSPAASKEKQMAIRPARPRLTMKSATIR